LWAAPTTTTEVTDRSRRLLGRGGREEEKLLDAELELLAPGKRKNCWHRKYGNAENEAKESSLSTLFSGVRAWNGIAGLPFCLILGEPLHFLVHIRVGRRHTVQLREWCEAGGGRIAGARDDENVTGRW
jgi:hypothetical protein